MNQWIKVSERLPEYGQQVVVLFHRCTKQRPCTWLFNGPFSPEVTHWMPIPEPPRSETSFEQFVCSDACPDDIGFGAVRKIWDAAIAAFKSPDYAP